MQRQGQKELARGGMRKAEMGRFNISPDEDSSSYSSNSDFNYSYPTKQAAMKRWVGAPGGGWGVGGWGAPG